MFSFLPFSPLPQAIAHITQEDALQHQRGGKVRVSFPPLCHLKKLTLKQMRSGEVSLCHLWDGLHDDKEERQEVEQLPLVGRLDACV